MPNIVKRTTLIVRDAARSLEFYRDVLGFSVWYDDEIVLSGRGLAAGRPGDRTRLVIMRAADPVVGMIGLLEFTAPRLPEPAAPRRALGIGDVCSSCRPTRRDRAPAVRKPRPSRIRRGTGYRRCT